MGEPRPGSTETRLGAEFWFSLAITAFIGGILALLLFETWALFTGHRPITDYVRPAVRAFPWWAFLIAVAVGIAVGHFLWDRRADKHP